MAFMIWRCFFEQSGTFKKVFRDLGFLAYDYDILNDFGETDFVVDLFQQIDDCFAGKASIFDQMYGDSIFAFFPCVRFSKQTKFISCCNNAKFKKLDDLKKIAIVLKWNDELHQLFSLLNKLVHICLTRSIRLVIENPYGDSFLTSYWCFRPQIVDLNRRASGDYYNKPTQYFFFGFEPKCNLLFDEPIAYYPPNKGIQWQSTVKRSLISPEYARRFVRSYLV